MLKSWYLKIGYLGDLWFVSGSTRRYKRPCSILLRIKGISCIKFLSYLGASRRL